MRPKTKFDFSAAYDEIFMDDAGRAENKLKKIFEIPISMIDDFPEHPYRVRDDEDMQTLTESIRTMGIITPVLIRRSDDNPERYEMISGHRRKYACEKLGIETIKADVVECTRDEAIILMVDSNAQRSQICLTDKGRAYKMKLEAMKRQGERTDLTSTPVAGKLKGESADIIGKDAGDSGDQVRRYIRLTELIPELQDYVDDGSMKMRPAVELSYLDEDTQRDVADRIIETGAFPSHDQAIRIRRAFDEGYASYECIRDIMDEEKPNQKQRVTITYERLGSLIPSEYTPKETEEYIIKALEVYKRLLIRQRDEAR